MAKAGIVIGIIFIIIFIGLLITGFIIANQKGYLTKDKESQINNSLTLYLMARDDSSKESITANYLLDYTYNRTQVKLSEGILKKSDNGENFWTEIRNIPNDKIIHVYGWNENHYLVKASKQFDEQEKFNNISKFRVDMRKIGNLEVTHTGHLYEKTNIIRINVTSNDGWFHNMGVALSWSPGVLDAYLQKDLILCGFGNWSNWSSYDEDSKIYTYLANHTYGCGEEIIEMCEFVEGNKCKTYPPLMPSRFIGIADRAVYSGETLAPGETYQLILVVRTLGNTNALDNVKMTFYDYDRRWSDAEQRLTKFSEYNGEDIGAKDFEYTIGF